jgi:hypothetical protein
MEGILRARPEGRVREERWKSEGGNPKENAETLRWRPACAEFSGLAGGWPSVSWEFPHQRVEFRFRLSFPAS